MARPTVNILPPSQQNVPLPYLETNLPVNIKVEFLEYIARIQASINQEGAYGVLASTQDHNRVLLFGVPWGRPYGATL